MLGNLLRLGFATQHLDQLPRGANQLVDELDHVRRETDGARLIGNGARDRLPNPPRGIRRKLVTAAVLKLVHCLHQADVALLDQVEERKPAIAILFGVATTRRRFASTSSFLACSASISPWMISRCVRCSSWKLTPASLSSLSRSARYCCCVLR